MSAKGMFESMRHKAHWFNNRVHAPLLPQWAVTHHGNKRRALARMKVKARRQERHAAEQATQQG